MEERTTRITLAEYELLYKIYLWADMVSYQYRTRREVKKEFLEELVKAIERYKALKGER